MSEDLAENLDGRQRSDDGGTNDGHRQSNVDLTLEGHIAENEFAEKDGIMELLFGEVVGGGNGGKLQKDEEFILERNKTLADIVKLGSESEF